MAEVAEVGQRAHADCARIGGRVAPAVVGEEDFARQHAVHFSILPHQLEASVALRPGRVKRVVEAADAAGPRFREDVSRPIPAAVVHGVELDVSLDGIVVRRDLLHAAEVAPHVELRHGLLLALRVRDGERHVRPRGAGRVHVDPQRLEGARVLAHELDVVAHLRDARLLHGRRVGVGYGVEVLRVAERGRRLDGTHAREAREVRGGHVVRRVEDDRRGRPRGRRVLARRRRERHQLRLDRGGHGLALRLGLRGGDERCDVNALHVRLRAAPRRDVGVERRRAAGDRAGDHGRHRKRGLDARHGLLVVGKHRRVGDSVGDVLVAAQEDGEVGIVRRRAVRLEAFEDAGARRGRLEREVLHARVALPRIDARAHRVGVRRAPARHLHVPPLGGKRLRERGAEAVRAAIDVAAAERPDLGLRRHHDGGGVLCEEDALRCHDDFVARRSARHLDVRRLKPQDRARREQRDVRVARRGRRARQVEGRLAGAVERARERERLRPRERHVPGALDDVRRVREDCPACLDLKRGELHRLLALAHVERAPRVDRHWNGL